MRITSTYRCQWKLQYGGLWSINRCVWCLLTAIAVSNRWHTCISIALALSRGQQSIPWTTGNRPVGNRDLPTYCNGRKKSAGKNKGQTPESGIPPSYRATRRYTKVHLGCCLRFSTLIGQIGRVPLFGAGPRRYIRSRLFRLAVSAFWRALPASWRQKGKRKQVFPRAIRTTELPSNPSPLTFRNNQIQIFQTSSTHATMAANVSQQDTNTHGMG